MTFKVAALFCDHMVMQCGIRVPVWGWAGAGDRITVRFAGQVKSTRADRTGKWIVALAPLKVSCESREMVVSSACEQKECRINDIVVGEVWVCSGQSNMEWTLANARDAAAEVAAAVYPNIRHFCVPRISDLAPAADITGSWDRCVPEYAASFSAVGYFFGREIHRKTGRPVGLINTSLGGTIAEAWTRREDFGKVPFLKRMLKEYVKELKNPDQTYLAEQAKWVEMSNRKDTRNLGETEGWHQPGTFDGNWETMDLPQSWQSAGHNYSGVFWFRREVQIPVAWEGRDLTLSLGPTDKSDVTYFNGVQVGSITMEQRPDAWSTPRVYTVPANLVKAGRAVIAVRVFSNIFAGGVFGLPSQMRLTPFGGGNVDLVSLAGAWAYKIEENFGLVPAPPAPPRGQGNPNSPHMLFDNMIQPLLPYAIRGAIWYQGESNADQARQYRTLFPLMIRSWRDAWSQGASAKSPERNFPFLFVQLANFQHPPKVPGECAWAELREAQTMALALPNTGMAVAMDIGEANDIHPGNKQDVGYRLSLPALAGVYGFKGLVTSGPIYKAMTREKGRIRLEFDHVAGGLVARSGVLKGFAIAGKDKKFVWADAVIEGACVVVSSPHVPKPVAVRYGWADNLACTLYNASDLPASPFRTDCP